MYEKDRSIVGHVAIWTIPAHIKGKEKLIGLRVDTMVDPNYQRQGIYSALNKQMIKQAKDDNITCLIGFPSKVAKKSLNNTDKVKTIGKVDRYIKINRPLSFTKHLLLSQTPANYPTVGIKERELTSINHTLPMGWMVEELDEFHEDLIRFIQKKSNWKSVQPRKCQEFLHWRFKDRPDKKYSTLVLTYYGEIKGYTIVNHFNKKQITVGSIVDMMAIDEPKAWEYLLKATTRFLSHADMVQLWICPDKRIDTYLKKQLFIKTDKPLTLVMHELDPLVKGIPMRDWWLTMGDIDSY